MHVCSYKHEVDLFQINFSMYHCRFSRVLEAPSDAWGEFKESLFCHDHEEVNFRHLPCSSDCFVADTSLLVEKVIYVMTGKLFQVYHYLPPFVRLQLFLVCMHLKN